MISRPLPKASKRPRDEGTRARNVKMWRMWVTRGVWVHDCSSFQVLHCLGPAPSHLWGGHLPLWGPERKVFVIAYGHIWKITYRFLTSSQTPQGPHLLLHRTQKQPDMIAQLPLQYYHILPTFRPVRMELCYLLSKAGSSTSSMDFSSFSFLGPMTYELSPLSYLTVFLKLKGTPAINI